VFDFRKLNKSNWMSNKSKPKWEAKALPLIATKPNGADGLPAEFLNAGMIHTSDTIDAR
jgi:hypothetical protein